MAIMANELADYEARCGRQPLTQDEVAEHVAAARRYLSLADATRAVETERVIVWLADYLEVQAVHLKVMAASLTERP